MAKKTIDINIQDNANQSAKNFEKFNGALGDVSAGLGLAQGAMSLAGEESEALGSAFEKVQTAMDIGAQVQGLQTAYKNLGLATRVAAAAQKAFTFVTKATSKSLKLFRVALIGTGIGALIVAVGLLIENFDKIGPVLKKVMSVALKPLKMIVDGLVASYYALTDALGITSKAERQREAQAKKNAANAKARAAREEKEAKARKEALEKEIELNKRLKEAEEKRFQTKIKLLESEGKSTIKLRKERAQAELDEAKAAQATVEKFGKFYSPFYKAISQANQQRIDEAQTTLNTIQKEEKDFYSNLQTDRINAARQIEDLENELKEEGAEKELEINRDKFRRLREDAERNTKLTRDERKKLIALYDKQELAQQKIINKKYIDLEKEKNKAIDDERDRLNQERIDKEDALFLLQLEADDDQLGIEIANLQKSYEQKYKLAEGNAELINDLYDKQLKDEEAIREKYRKEAEAKQKEIDDKKRAETQALNTFITDSALQTLDVVNQFAQLRADKFKSLNQQILDNEELTDKQKEKMLAENNRKAKRAFEIQKAANIAQALISTYQSANAIFASTAANPISIANPAAPFIAAGLAVAGGLANVASISRQKFEGASLGGGGDTGAPDLTGGETVAPSFNVVGDSSLNQLAQLQQTPTQAFVVSGEVTSAQALDRNRVTNATL